MPIAIPAGDRANGSAPRRPGPDRDYETNDYEARGYEGRDYEAPGFPSAPRRGPSRGSWAWSAFPSWPKRSQKAKEAPGGKGYPQDYGKGYPRPEPRPEPWDPWAARGPPSDEWTQWRDRQVHAVFPRHDDDSWAYGERTRGADEESDEGYGTQDPTPPWGLETAARALPRDDDEDAPGGLGTLLVDKEWASALALWARAPRRDKDGYALVLQACKLGGQWRQALQLVAESLRYGVADPDLCVCAVQACQKAKRFQHALQVLPLLEEHRVDPAAPVLKALLVACGQAGFADGALALLSRLDDVDVVALNTALKACASQGHWPKALKLLRSMPQPDVVSFTTAIRACERGRCCTPVLPLLAEMRAQRVEPNVITYTSAVAVLAQCGKPRKALELFDEMEQYQVRPDTVAYNAALSACERCGAWQQAQHLIGDMQQKGVLYNLTTYAQGICALCSGTGGAWETALKLLRHTPNPKVWRNAQCFAAVAGCCFRASWPVALELLASRPPAQACAPALRSALLAGPDVALQAAQVLQDQQLPLDPQALQQLAQRFQQQNRPQLSQQAMDLWQHEWSGNQYRKKRG